MVPIILCRPNFTILFKVYKWQLTMRTEKRVVILIITTSISRQRQFRFHISQNNRVYILLQFNCKLGIS